MKMDYAKEMNLHLYEVLEMKNQIGNELKSKNENDLKMKNGNEPEMKPKNELEMNEKIIVKMNEENKTNLINNLKQYHKQGKVITMENYMKTQERTMTIKELTIEQIKRECYNINGNYVPSIKLITDEPSDIIKNTLRRDLRNYNEIWGFICQGNTITMRLKSNAEPVIYYFENHTNLGDILIELVKFCNENDLQIKGVQEE